MYTVAISVMRLGSCILWPYLLSVSDHVYCGHICYASRTMYTVAISVMYDEVMQGYHNYMSNS